MKGRSSLSYEDLVKLIQSSTARSVQPDTTAENS